MMKSIHQFIENYGYAANKECFDGIASAYHDFFILSTVFGTYNINNDSTFVSNLKLSFANYKNIKLTGYCVICMKNQQRF